MDPPASDSLIAQRAAMRVCGDLLNRGEWVDSAPRLCRQGTDQSTRCVEENNDDDPEDHDD